MANQWFKFYGGEYLSDPKIKSLSVFDRQCWTVLLCHASLSNGRIKYLTEKQLMLDAGIDPFGNEWPVTEGVFARFSASQMIKISDGEVIILNWNKRQEMSLTGAERTKRYRENKDKIKNNQRHTDVTSSSQKSHKSDARIEENRIEENRIEREKGMRGKTLTPVEEAQEFFEEGERYRELLEMFATGKDLGIIEKEFKKFMLYWTEKNKSGTKMRWEQQKTFEVKRRLFTWFSNFDRFAISSKGIIL